MIYSYPGNIGNRSLQHSPESWKYWELKSFSRILGILEISVFLYLWTPGNIGNFICLVSWYPGFIENLILKLSHILETLEI